MGRATSQGGGSRGDGYNSDLFSPSESSDKSNSGSSVSYDATVKDSFVEMGLNKGSGKGTPKAPHDTSGYPRTRYGKKEHVSGYSTGTNRDE